MPMINNDLSLYIPRVHKNVTRTCIQETFRGLGIGEINRVDFVDYARETPLVNQIYRQAFIYFAYWNKTPITENLQQQILNKDINAKIVYNEPYYWYILPNKTPISLRKRVELDQTGLILELKDRIEHLESLIKIMSSRIFKLTVSQNQAQMLNINNDENNFKNYKIAVDKDNNRTIHEIETKSDISSLTDETSDATQETKETNDDDSEYIPEQLCVQSTIPPNSRNYALCGIRNEYPASFSSSTTNSDEETVSSSSSSDTSDQSYDVITPI